MCIVSAGTGDDKCRVQRGYSWRLSRPSLRRKQKHRSGSDSDAIVLNNGRDHAACNGIKDDIIHKNKYEHLNNYLWLLYFLLQDQT